MPKNAYYGPYPNPNLIIVPTVNFCHPPLPTESGQIADPITNNPTINCEQISPATNNIGHPSPYVSNYNQQNLQFMNAEPFFNNTSSPEFSENFQNTPLIYQDPISTQASSSNMSQSIKELSASKYKSSNNLVDLTGFNLLKIHSVSTQTKRQDLNQTDDTNINPDKKIKTSSEKELRHCSESDTCKTDNKTKEFAKNLKSMISNGKEKPENHANGKPNDNTKGHIQKFHRQLSSKNKDKATKEKLSGVIKSSSSKKSQESKKSKHECSKSKTHLQTTSKRNSTSTNDLRNKITEGSKKYRDLERRFVAKYPKNSKTETNSRKLQDSKVSSKDKEIGLHPDCIQRYKDFQRFISHCDEIKYSENQQKTKSLPSKKIRIESCENTNIKRNIDVKKKKYEIKEYLKSEKHSKVSAIQTSLENVKNNTNIEKAKDQTNTDKALIKNIVRGDRKLPTKLSPRMGVEGVQDLRSKLSRKRSRSDSFVHNQKLKDNSLNRESLVISVKQDVEAGSKNSPILALPVDEPKAKKCKPTELIKDIKYPDSDSGDIDKDSPEDLSFLDDLIIHADEIVASLPRSSKFEHLLCSSFMMTTTDNIKSELIKKISANGNKDNGKSNPKKSLINNDNMETIEINKTNGYYSKNNEKTKFKEDLNNYNSMKAIKIIKKEETSLHKSQKKCSKINEKIKLKERLINNMKVKGISSNTDGEDINFEIGSIGYTKKHEGVKNINQDSKNDRNSQHEENTNTDMTEKVYEEIGQKEAMHLSKDKQIIIITITGIKTNKEANNTADLTKKHHVENAPKETTSLYKTKQKIITDSELEIHNEQANNMADLTEKRREEIARKETTTPCKAEEKFMTNSKYEVNIIQEANDVTDLTRKDYEENAPKETKSLCKAKQNITTDSKIYDFTGKGYEESTPKETTSPCKAKESILTNSKCEANIIQKATDVTDLTGNGYEEIAPKETRRLSKDKRKTIKTNSKYDVNTNKTKKHANYLTGEDLIVKLCDDSDDSVVEVIDITDENEHNTTSKNLQPNVNRIFLINKSNKPDVNTRTDLGSKAKVIFCEHDNETRLDTRRAAFEMQVKQKSESSNTDQKQTQLHKSADPFETSFQSEFSIKANISINKTGAISDVLKQTTTLDKHVKENNDNSQNSKDTVATVFNNSDQNGSILKHIEPNQIHGCAKNLKENSLKKSTDAMEVSFETVFNCTNQQDIGIYEPGLSGQPLNKEIVDVLKTPQSTIEPVTIIDFLDQDKNENERIEIKMSKVDKYMKIETETQESVKQILQETTKNNNEQNVTIQIDTSPLKVSNIQENLLQKSGIHKAPLCRSNKTFKEQVQTFEYTFNKLANKPINYLEKKTQNGSENSTKETPETVNSNLAQNNEAESETLQISEEKIQTSTNTTIVTTKLEPKGNNRIQSDTSDKNVEEKAISLENSEIIISEESQEKTHTLWSRIEYKTDVTTSEGTKPDRNKDDTSEKSEVVTNTKKVVKKSLVSDGGKNKDETRSNKHEIQLSSRPWHYKLELRMSEYLQKEYTISSVIHSGHYSTVYKCIDAKGGAYALKIVERRPRGIFLEGVLSQLQRYRPKQDSCILYLMNAFEFQDRWCLLTEYFPKNLEQVLNENKRGFHIDQVQVLSRQLVYAVNILASAGIIHSDIKPAHILLNSAQDRLKLCGFDRCNYFNCIRITPSSGSPKYRAPEVILGFQANHRIDVWSTGLVIFEMATSKSLFNAHFNNGLLYEQLCTFGSLNWTMVEQSRNRYLYFSGFNFIRRLGPKGQQQIMIYSLERNDNLRKILFESYNQYWAQDKSKWQITKETDKLETLHTLLEQMLVLDPRHRLLIHFVNASEFMNHTLKTA